MGDGRRPSVAKARKFPQPAVRWSVWMCVLATVFPLQAGAQGMNWDTMLGSEDMPGSTTTCVPCSTMTPPAALLKAATAAAGEWRPSASDWTTSAAAPAPPAPRSTAAPAPPPYVAPTAPPPAVASAPPPYAAPAPPDYEAISAEKSSKLKLNNAQIGGIAAGSAAFAAVAAGAIAGGIVGAKSYKEKKDAETGFLASTSAPSAAPSTTAPVLLPPVIAAKEAPSTLSVAAKAAGGKTKNDGSMSWMRENLWLCLGLVGLVLVACCSMALASSLCSFKKKRKVEKAEAAPEITSMASTRSDTETFPLLRMSQAGSVASPTLLTPKGPLSPVSMGPILSVAAPVGVSVVHSARAATPATPPLATPLPSSSSVTSAAPLLVASSSVASTSAAGAIRPAQVIKPAAVIQAPAPASSQLSGASPAAVLR
mmetsp:Transcript_70573/g.133127  ORF Transcript_70573/g.133127 Transcript_70573/m.133127 type:complete len:425 (-) Transcript_70573:134-1408(-)